METSKFVLFLTFALLAGFAYIAITWTNGALHEIRAGAANSNGIEVEYGVLSQAATAVQDVTASNGEYVRF